MDYSKVADVIADTIAVGSSPLTKNQRLAMLSAISVCFDLQKQTFEKHMAETVRRMFNAKLDLLAIAVKPGSNRPAGDDAAIREWDTRNFIANQILNTKAGD